MSMTFHWEPDPIILANRLNAVAAGLENRMLPLAGASEAIRADIAERFETETDPNGNPWTDWSDEYRPYAEAYPNEGILTQSGDLAEAASSTEATVVTADSVFYRTDALPHYGLAHDQGIPDRKYPLPQREFLGMSDESASLVLAEFYRWFEGALDLYVTTRGNIGRRHALRGEAGRFIPASEFVSDFD